MEITAEVRRARLAAGLTQEELARRMGTTQSAVSRLESGRIQPSLDTLEQVAQACSAKLEVRLELPHPAEDFESSLALTSGSTS